MVTIGAVGGVLHLSPEYPTNTLVAGGNGGAEGGQKGSSQGQEGKDAKATGGKNKGWFGISFLSEEGTPRAEEGEGGMAGGNDIQAASGLRLIEDRTVLAASSASWWRGVVGGKGAKAVGEAAGQGALAAVLVLLGGGIVLMLMRWRRRGPWSPRMPR